MKSTNELINKLSKKRKSEERRYNKNGIGLSGLNSNLTDKPKKNVFNKRVQGVVRSTVSTHVKMGS